MKLLLTLAALAVMANAGLLSTLQGVAMDKVKIDHEYVIDTNGYNPRIYEWTTKSGMKCIALFSSSSKSSAPALQCQYPKGH